jgi:[ribosomal protein S18]-alanine N-acetyltransferase
MTTLIRQAGAADIKAICKVLCSSPEAGQWSEPAVGRLCDEESVLVGEVDGQIAGFIVARAIGPEWEIENVAVAPGFRRQGIARRLVAAVIAHARQEDAAAIYLEVRESNAAARGLYSSFGFVESTRRPAYYRNPPEAAVVYRLALNPELDLN